MDELDSKVADKHVRKIRACLKRLQTNTDGLKDLLTLDELKQLALHMSAWDKHVSSKINK